MKAKCDRAKLLHAFQIAAAVAPVSSPKPIAQMILLDATGEVPIVMATDYEVGIRVQVSGLDAQDGAKLLLPPERFLSILRESPDETLNLESDGTSVRVWGQQSQFQLPTQNPEEFPPVEPFDAESYYQFPATLLRTIVARTAFATDPTAGHYALGGVLFELLADRVIGVGTDGRRLAKQEGPAESVGQAAEENAPIVPIKAVQLLGRAVEGGEEQVEIAVRENDLVVRCGEITVRSRLVEGRFPPWRDVFPDTEGWPTVELSVGPMLSAVRQAAIVTGGERRGVQFNVTEGKLVLAAHAAEYGESQVEMPIAYSGAEIAVSLDPRFMIDFLRALDAEQSFVMRLRDGETPVVCTTDDNYGYVVMPMAQGQGR